MKLRKLLALCLVLILAVLPITANAASGDDSISFGDLLDAWTSGPCGESVNWALDKAGTLTITGTGPMTDYASGPYVPWYSKRTAVKTVIIEIGVTAIGNYAFNDCTGLTDVYYDGTKAQWDALPKGSNNELLLAATLHVADVQIGDLDASGTLTTDDAVYLLLHVMFGAEDYPVPGGMNLDYNTDGKVDTNDAVYLLLHVMFGAEDYPIPAVPGENVPTQPDNSAIVEYVDANREDLIRELESGFAEGTDMTCTSDVFVEGMGFVITLKINELDNLDDTTKQAMQEAFNSMDATFGEVLTIIRQELPELEYYEVRVCEVDGDPIATVLVGEK